MADPKPHELTTCPYNPAHQVEHYRMHIHLQKCRKQYPNQRMVTCAFDTTHTINEVELDYHITVCPKRLMLDQQQYVTDDEHRPPVQVEAQPLDINCEENWDDDNVIGYKPDPAKKGAPIITKAQGMTKSERRRARMEGRLAYAHASRPPTENE